MRSYPSMGEATAAAMDANARRAALSTPRHLFGSAVDGSSLDERTPEQRNAPTPAELSRRVDAALALHTANYRGKGTMASQRYCPECGMPIPCATRNVLTGGTP